jgi:putative oxidoreductase
VLNAVALPQAPCAKTFLDISVRSPRSRPPAPVIAEVMTAGAAILLLIGLWTPFAGGLVAVAELALALSHPGNPWTFVHFGVLGAALAMLGPGGCSVDARLFGRKHIEIPQR